MPQHFDYRYSYNFTGSQFRRSKYPMPPKAGWGHNWYNDARQWMTVWNAILLSRAGNMMFRMGLKEIRKHIPLRFLYMDNLEYEVGYLVYQVFHRYQMMLEVYEVAYQKYYLRKPDQIAPTRYMVYLYLRMFRLSFHIIHLCNMAHEMHKKFVGHDSIFTHTEPPKIGRQQARKIRIAVAQQKVEVDNVFAQIDIVNDNLAKLQKAKKKAIKKERKRQKSEGLVKYQPTRKPTQPWRHGSPKAVIYGWSIEDWWLS